MNLDYDVAIIGAGPGGATTALALENSGLRVALIEKDTFPRDKICGDAIPGPAFKILTSLGYSLEEEMRPIIKSNRIKSSMIVAPNDKSLTVNWVATSYNSPRLHFDNLLVSLVKQNTKTEIHENFKVQAIERLPNGFNIRSKSKSLFTKFIVGADGANSLVAKRLGNHLLDKNHHCAAVRAYYSNVKGVELGRNEFYLLKNFLPGYFWIFPVGENKVNIGFGMFSKQVAKRKINLRSALSTIIETHPKLKIRFKDAQLDGKITGFGLPLASRKATLYGERFILVGDAGSLIDPLGGHGIDKAMLTGKDAAEEIIQAFKEGKQDGFLLKKYEQKVYKKIGKSAFYNYWLMRFFTGNPLFLNLVMSIATHPVIKRIVLKLTSFN